MPKGFVSLKEAAKLLSVHYNSIHRQVLKFQVPGAKLLIAPGCITRRKWYVPMHWITKTLKERSKT